MPVQCSGSPAFGTRSGCSVKPALAALRFRARVPRDAERLEPAAGHLDQVLLQRCDAERVLDLVVGGLPVGAVGADHEPAIAPEEGRRDAGMGEARVLEVAGDRPFLGRRHRDRVLRLAPPRGLRRVALRARRGADVLRGRTRRHGRLGRRGRSVLSGALPRHHGHRCDHHDRRKSEEHRASAARRRHRRSRARRRGRRRRLGGGAALRLPRSLAALRHRSSRGPGSRCIVLLTAPPARSGRAEP